MTDEARPIPEGLEEAIRPMLYEGTMLGFVNSQVEAIARFVMEREAAAVAPLREVLERFVMFGLFAEAIVNADGEEALKPETVLVSVMGAGASDNLRFEDFLRAEKALKALGEATQ